MTTVNLVNPFQASRAFTYFRFTPIGSGQSQTGGTGGDSLGGIGVCELAFASTIGGANLLPSATVTAPTFIPAALPISNMWDGLDSSGGYFDFANGLSGSTGYFQAQFASPTVVREIRIRSGNATFWTGARHPSMFSFAGSNDGTNWTWLGVYTTTPWPNSTERSFVINQVPLASGRANSRVWTWRHAVNVASRNILEMEYATSAGGADLTSPPTWPQNPTGDFVAHTNTWASFGVGQAAFDNNTGTGHIPNTSSQSLWTLTYFFSSAPNPTHYRIGTNASGTFTWKLYYLTDGANWVEADSRAEAWAGVYELKTFEMAA